MFPCDAVQGRHAKGPEPVFLLVGRPGLDPGTLGLKVPTYVSTQSVQAQILGF